LQISDPEPPADTTQEPLHPRAWLRPLYAVLVGFVGIAALVAGLDGWPAGVGWPAVLVFAALSFLVQRSSFHLRSPMVHSLAGVIDVAALLALGRVPGALVAVLSGTAYLGLNALRHQRLDRRHLLEIPLFNAGLKALMALAGGSLYLALGTELPLVALNGRAALAAAVLSVFWFALDQLGWALWDYIEGGRARLQRLIRNAVPTAMLIELVPLPFAIIVALVYTRLDWLAFGLLALVIVAVSVLIQRWADARSALVQRVAELTTIEEVGRAIVEAELDLAELSQLMYDYARRVSDTTIFHLGLFDGDEYVLKLRIRDGERMPEQRFQMSPGVGLVNWMRETKQPLLVRDFAREMESLPARPAYVSEQPPRSALYVPLIAGETVIGTMSVQSLQPDAYNESDLRALSAMGNLAAVAMQKAQAYEQARKRARQLMTIGEVSRHVTATLELERLFERVVRLIRDAFGYYHVGIFTADPQREAVQFQASASAGTRDVSFDVEWGQGLIGWVAAQGEPLRINDVEQEPRYRCIDALEDTRSELAVPLLLEDELVGVLDVQSDVPGAFGTDDLFILETLGTQIAIAIQQARLYQAERQQAWLSTALLQVADAMSQVSDMDAVVTTIVRLTPILAGVDRCVLLLWDDVTESFVPAQSYGLPAELRKALEQLAFPLGMVPALDLVRLDKNPLLIDMDEHPELLPESLVETFGIREMVVLPLLAQGELLGVMLVDYAGRPHHFSEREISMLSGIANQAAMVLQTARLVQAQQEEAYVSMALLQVAEAVSRSTHLQDMLAAVVRITPMLVGVGMIAILVRDEASGAFLPGEQYGLEQEGEEAFYSLHLAAQDPLVRRLRQGDAFVAINDLEQPSAALEIVNNDSALALPLASKGEVLGLMIVESERNPRHFSQRWMNILSGIAGQAAIAVENDRLLQEAAEQERIRQELEVAKRIQTSFLPESCPDVPGWELAALWRSARQVGGDFYDFVPLPPLRDEGQAGGQRLGVVIADVADKGVPAALFMALSRTLVRTMAIDGREPASAIAGANQLIIADARAGLFVTLFYVVLRPGSGDITYVNAGHVPPLWVQSEAGSVQEVRVPGMALGVLEQVEFEQHQASLELGDSLILYTDGVTDASNERQQMFGRQRLAETARQFRHESTEGLLRRIDEAVAQHVGEFPQSDDFTLVIARRKA
jgi:serine phosphatase RsbU (regulator of sigma subunit)/putative methionine-R-sulfoxide reductase with GAF domain